MPATESALMHTLVMRSHPLEQSPGTFPVRAGQTLEGMLREVAQGAEIAHAVSVSIGGIEVPRKLWAKVRPKAGVPIHVTGVPKGGSGILRAVLMIAVAVFAWWAAPIVGAALGVSSTLVAGGLYMLGTLAVNALVPPPKPPTPLGTEGRWNALTGTSNQINPYGAIPIVLGESRFHPPHAAMPYSQSVGSDSYQYCMFDLGFLTEGAEVTDLRIGDTPLSSYSDVTYEITTTPTLYTSDVAETSIGSTLEDGESLERTTAPDVEEISLDLIYGQGLFGVGTSGKGFSMTVDWDFQYRPVGTTVWLSLPSPRLSGFQSAYRVFEQNRKPFAVGVAWDVPKGQYEVRVTRVNTQKGSPDNTYVDEAMWTVMRSIRRTNPSRTGTTKLVMRIRANDQVNGTLQQLSCMIRQKVPVWNGTQWTAPQFTCNTAWIFAWLLRSCPALAVHVPDTRIDVRRIAAYAAFCDQHEFGTRMVLDARTTARQLLGQVLASSLGSLGQTNGKYSVVFDDGDTLPTQMFTPLDTQNFSVTRTFTRLPQALKVRFRNPLANWEDDEIIVLDDGYSYRGKDARGNPSNAPEPTEFETLELGIACYPEQAWRLGRAHFAQAKFRPCTYEWGADVSALGCARGAVVHVAHDVTEWGAGWGRVVAAGAGGPLAYFVQLDETITTEAGESYAMQVRRVDGSGVIQTQESYLVTPHSVETDMFYLSQQPTLSPGDVVVIGASERVTEKLLLTGIRPGDELTFNLSAVAYDARVAPYWANPPTSITSEITGSAYTDPPPPPNISVVLSQVANDTPDDGGVTRSEVHVGISRASGFMPIRAQHQAA